ncbi:hypothetical protein [Acidovorax sp.]|uniref:hypothetical protein n=1 Tax=Acidovorax sp. TaxID=1872122 RepID=UPI0025C17D65|nr:hypothetical protein [Acidovorax sp.]MBL7089525.1 hypothetical protein [Acidovorax sp.]
MIFSTQFGGGAALGSIVQGYGLAEPLYVACDGRPLARATYPRLSTLFPIGRFTGTVRTLATTSGNNCLAASPTYFVSSAAAGNPNIQYSTDGASWSQVSVVTPSMTVNSLIFAGTRWVASGAVSGTLAVTTGDNPNSTWAATTGGATGGIVRYGLAYSVALGRVISLTAGSTTALQALDNGSTTLVAKTAPTAKTRMGICHTGTKFIILNTDGTITTSADAASSVWVDEPLPESVASTGSIASNGAGVIVISGAASGLLVSTDHGVTWVKTAIPGVAPSATWQVNYSGDRFFLPTTLGVVMSMDGKAWFLEPQLIQLRAEASVFAKKGAIFVQTQNSATAYSFTESATHFNAPLIQAYAPVASGSPIPLAPSFIKAL